MAAAVILVPSGPKVKILWFCRVFIVCVVLCTHVDDRVLELDVEPVVRNGNDGFVGTAKILHPFPLKNWERHLYGHKQPNGLVCTVKTLHQHLFIVRLLYVF